MQSRKQNAVPTPRSNVTTSKAAEEEEDVVVDSPNNARQKQCSMHVNIWSQIAW